MNKYYSLVLIKTWVQSRTFTRMSVVPTSERAGHWATSSQRSGLIDDNTNKPVTTRNNMDTASSHSNYISGTYTQIDTCYFPPLITNPYLSTFIAVGPNVACHTRKTPSCRGVAKTVQTECRTPPVTRSRIVSPFTIYDQEYKNYNKIQQQFVEQ